jgi:hypothetical protein
MIFSDLRELVSKVYSDVLLNRGLRNYILENHVPIGIGRHRIEF